MRDIDQFITIRIFGIKWTSIYYGTNVIYHIHDNDFVFNRKLNVASKFGQTFTSINIIISVTVANIINWINILRNRFSRFSIITSVRRYRNIYFCIIFLCRLHNWKISRAVKLKLCDTKQLRRMKSIWLLSRRLLFIIPILQIHIAIYFILLFRIYVFLFMYALYLTSL